MPLSPAQFTTLKNAIIASPTAGPMRAAGDTPTLLAWCNAPSATVAWRDVVLPQESDEAATYTLFDGVIAGKRDSWQHNFLRYSRDFQKAKIRNWIVDVWGPAIASSVAEAILQAGTGFATNAQAVFGGTSPATGTVTALRRTWNEMVSSDEVNRLVN